MSGGHWDYIQSRLTYVYEDIESLIEKNGKLKDKDDLHFDPEFYDKYPEELSYYKYPDEVIAKFKEAIPIIKQAQVYMQRIDWLLSGDDGEESFIERLKEDLKDI